MPPILRMPYQQPAVVNQCNRLNKCSKRIDRGLNFLLQSWTLHVKIIFQSVLHCVCSTLMFVNTKSLTGWNAKQYNVIHFQPHLYLWSRFQILFFFRQPHWFHSCEVIVTSSDELRRNERSFTSMHDHGSWHETLNLLLSFCDVLRTLELVLQRKPVNSPISKLAHNKLANTEDDSPTWYQNKCVLMYLWYLVSLISRTAAGNRA